jgi:hypothetical protein
MTIVATTAIANAPNSFNRTTQWCTHRRLGATLRHGFVLA